MLKVESLSKSYGKTLAVENLNFELHPGELIGLLGPNGAGKSTTIKCIIGLLRKTSGTITVNGHDHLSVEAKAKFAYIPEVPELYDLLSVWEHLQFIAQAYRLKAWEEYANQLLERYDMLDKKEKIGKDLSKGMKQKVSICCGLLHHPDYIFFDEPMIGLDPKAIKETKKILLEQKNAGKGLLISTHLVDSVENITDRLMILKESSMVAYGHPDELKNQFGLPAETSMEDLFLSITDHE